MASIETTLWATEWVLPAALLVALAVDALLGEPSVRWHPVVAMGRLLDALGRRVAPPTGHAHDARRVHLRGALAWSLGAALVLALACAVTLAIRSLPPALQALLLGLALKPLLAWRMLREEVLAVEQALAESLDAGRTRVARLVSRDVSKLDAVQVREAAISTLAENFNDSVLAPLFWFALGGLPGAALYRYANTADAMWGYRGERGGRDWTWAGRWAARTDDLLSWLPARLSGVLLALPGLRWSALAAQAPLTPSPNGGWPMSAVALALGIRLGKPGVYQLHATGRAVAPQDTLAACRRCDARLLWLALAVALFGVGVAWS